MVDEDEPVIRWGWKMIEIILTSITLIFVWRFLTKYDREGQQHCEQEEDLGNVITSLGGANVKYGYSLGFSKFEASSTIALYEKGFKIHSLVLFGKEVARVYFADISDYQFNNPILLPSTVSTLSISLCDGTCIKIKGRAAKKLHIHLDQKP